MQRKRLSLTLVVTLLLVVGLFAVSQIPNMQIFAQEEQQPQTAVSTPADSSSKARSCCLTRSATPIKLLTLRKQRIRLQSTFR